MGAKKKTILRGFDYMHCDDFAKLLDDMAAKGWHFKEWGVGLKFEKGEPENATYAVEVFAKASENDMRPELHTQEFAEYCEAAGWKFVDSKQKFCIFKKVNEDAVELFTPEERVLNSFKAMISGYAITLVILYFFNALMQWINIFNMFERYIFSGLFVFNFSVWNVMLLGQLFTFLYAFLKKNRLLKDIRNGEEIYIGSKKDGKFHISVRDIYILVLIALLTYFFFVINRMDIALINAFIIGVTVVFCLIIAKVRPESNMNVILQIIFSFVLVITLVIFTMTIIVDDGANASIVKDELPLEISDYRECTDEIEDIDIYHDANFLGSVDTYYIFAKENSVYYYVYESGNTKILDKIWEEELDTKYNEGAIDCASDWEAEKAFRNKLGTYYVRYENVIFIINDAEDVYLNVDQINIIRDKLDLR